MERAVRSLNEKLTHASPGLVAQGNLLLLCFLTLLDYLTGHHVSFSFFYLIPVSVAAWYGHRYLSYLIATVAAAAGQIVNELAGEPHLPIAVALWNDLLQFFFFFVVAQLLIKLKAALTSAQMASQHDYLTGLMNRRTLEERLEGEIARAARTGSTLSVGFLDLDRFKSVNDQFGHAEGDRLLVLVSQAIQSELRRSDLVARVGGDEFVLVLTHCTEQSAQMVAEKVLRTIQEIAAQNGWPVTASLGLVHLEKPKAFENIEKLISEADRQMYLAKESGKNCYRSQSSLP